MAREAMHVFLEENNGCERGDGTLVNMGSASGMSGGVRCIVRDGFSCLIGIDYLGKEIDLEQLPPPSGCL